MGAVAKNGIKSLDEAEDIAKAGKNALEEVAGKVNTINPNDLMPNQNLRMGRNKFNKFVEDIKTYGIQEPIKYVEYNGKKYVVDGHHRLSVAKRLGLKEVPIEKVELPYLGYKSVEDLLNWGD